MLLVPLIIPLGMFIFSVKEWIHGDSSMSGYVLAVPVAVAITALLAL